MGSVNKVIIVGRVGGDPEIRSTQGGKSLANFTVATNEFWKDKDSGERKEKTEWHRVVIFNEHAVKLCENYIKKGSQFYIEGQLQTRKWQDKDGADRYTTEVVVATRGCVELLDGKEDKGADDGGDNRRDPPRERARPATGKKVPF
jgi:single-strand DNA-binding protein